MKEIRSNIDPKDLSDALLKTFKNWMEFSLGLKKLGGRKLDAPSGRMAAALRAEYNLEGDVVALYVDPNEAGALEANVLQHGHKGFSLKRRMLFGNPKAKRSKAGYLYRYIPIADSSKSPKKTLQESSLKNLFTTRDMPQGGVLQINRNLATIFASNSKKAHTGSTKIRTMSSKPGSARWFIPKMPAFNIQKILRDSVPTKYRGRIIV